MQAGHACYQLSHIPKPLFYCYCFLLSNFLYVVMHICIDAIFFSCVWRLKVDVRTHSLLTFTLFIEARSLYQTQSSTVWVSHLSHLALGFLFQPRECSVSAGTSDWGAYLTYQRGLGSPSFP